MLKDLYDLESRKRHLNLGQQVDNEIEFDLMVDSLDIYFRDTKIIDDERVQFTHYINDSALPLRYESNGSILVTLKEIEEYLINIKSITHFVVNFESPKFGAIFLYGNYGAEWTLHGITNGYA